MTWIIHLQLWGYKLKHKLYLGVREQKRLDTTGLHNSFMAQTHHMFSSRLVSAWWGHLQVHWGFTYEYFVQIIICVLPNPNWLPLIIKLAQNTVIMKHIIVTVLYWGKIKIMYAILVRHYRILCDIQYMLWKFIKQAQSMNRTRRYFKATQIHTSITNITKS
jgi:hypothetical protein